MTCSLSGCGSAAALLTAIQGGAQFRILLLYGDDSRALAGWSLLPPCGNWGASPSRGNIHPRTPYRTDSHTAPRPAESPSNANRAPTRFLCRPGPVLPRYTTDWSGDDTHRWHACTCPLPDSEKDGVTAHSSGTGTCKDKVACAVCDVTYGGNDPSNPTDGTQGRDAAEATGSADGYTGDTCCLGFGEKIAAGTIIPKKDIPSTAYTETGFCIRVPRKRV